MAKASQSGLWDTKIGTVRGKGKDLGAVVNMLHEKEEVEGRDRAAKNVASRRHKTSAEQVESAKTALGNAVIGHVGGKPGRYNIGDQVIVSIIDEGPSIKVEEIEDLKVEKKNGTAPRTAKEALDELAPARQRKAAKKRTAKKSNGAT